MQLPSYPAAGEPIPARWGKEVVDFLRSLRPSGCSRLRVKWLSAGTTFSVGAAAGGGNSGTFSGVGHAPDGNRTTGLNSDSTKEYVRWSDSAWSFSEAETEPIPWPQGDRYWEKSSVSGDVYA